MALPAFPLPPKRDRALLRMPATVSLGERSEFEADDTPRFRAVQNDADADAEHDESDSEEEEAAAVEAEADAEFEAAEHEHDEAEDEGETEEVLEETLENDDEQAPASFAATASQVGTAPALSRARARSAFLRVKLMSYVPRVLCASTNRCVSRPPWRAATTPTPCRPVRCP